MRRNWNNNKLNKLRIKIKKKKINKIPIMKIRMIIINNNRSKRMVKNQVERGLENEVITTRKLMKVVQQIHC